MKKRTFAYIVIYSLCVMLLSCYDQNTSKHDASAEYTEEQMDSLSFQSTHHYTNNFNFIVTKDSIYLLRQQPEEYISQLPTDSLVVYKNDVLAVADIRIIENDQVDSVWIQLARDQETFGWIHETEMLQNVVPDDPISMFISVFSDIHLLFFLIFCGATAAIYLIRKLYRHNVPLVHISDIATFYPTLLAVIVAASATFYSSIQLFAPEMWRHFYYHPTLNPFAVPLLLRIFLISVWAIVILSLATIDDVRRHLPPGQTLLYLSGLAAVCAINYIVFSITTLYYIGYPFLFIYFIFAIYQYWNNGYSRFTCGNCGQLMHSKGRCPHCGTINK